MFRNSPLLSRAMALLLLVGLVAGVAAGIVLPLIEYRQEQRAEIANAERLIAGFAARRSEAVALRARLDRLRQDPGARAAFLDARSTTLAAARLQSRVKAMTEAAGARLLSTQVIGENGASGDVARVIVRTQMIASVEALRQIFHALEGGSPAILLDNLSVSVHGGTAAQRGRAAGGETGLLTVRYDAIAFLWPDGRPS